MIRRPPRSKRTYTLSPYTTLCRSLEHEQGPDRGSVVAYAARVLVQQALDERHIEKIDLFQQAREKPPPDRLLQRAAEPVRQRDGESHLLAVENLARQPILHCLLQQVLSLARLQPIGGRQGRSPFQELVVEQGNPDLQRGRHAGTIRSEEHTSELQSLMRISYAVFCLKKKNKS